MPEVPPVSRVADLTARPAGDAADSLRQRTEAAFAPDGALARARLEIRDRARQRAMRREDRLDKTA